jgi:hypothetical protein
MVIEGIVMPPLTILEMIDNAGTAAKPIPLVAYGDRRYVVQVRHRLLNEMQNALYLQCIVILRTHKVYSMCGDSSIHLEVGRELFVDGFTTDGEVYVTIKDYDYELHEGYYMISHTMRKLFSQYTPVQLAR